MNHARNSILAHGGASSCCAPRMIREIWARPLSDRTLAVGLFNRGLAPSEVTVHWSQLGLEGRQPVRDLWQRKDLGATAEKFTATVPRHGAVFLKIGKPR